MRVNAGEKKDGGYMHISNQAGFSWKGVPIIRDALLAWRGWCDERALPHYSLASDSKAHPELCLYPIDMSPLLRLPFGDPDENGVLYNAPSGDIPALYHPTSIAQYALACWNAYLANGDDGYRVAFETQANWLLDHEVRFPNGAGGWPIPFTLEEFHVSKPWLSALTQGNVISVFVRVYQLTGESAYLQAARRAVRTFELDILDGGVSSLLASEDIFFEEVAAYPAAHVLNGYILALFGLYDYVALTHDDAVEALIRRSLTTFHEIIDAFDAGYWSRYDLLHKHLVPLFYHALHIVLLKALADYSGCEHCAQLAARWEKYQRRFTCRLRYVVISRVHLYWSRRGILWLRHFMPGVSRENDPVSLVRVCVPITAFPVAGGMRGVLDGVAQAMSERWKMVYLTHQQGRDAQGLEIDTFGFKLTHPWQFPSVWLYSLVGWFKLFALMRRRPYEIILPQDGVCTGAFAGLVGKIAGARVVCMDHGSVTLLNSPAFRSELLSSLKTYPWYHRIFARLQLELYWPSLRFLARIASHYADQFLVAGDEVEAVYRKSLGVLPSRIVRYPYIVDAARFTPPDKETRAKMRVEHGMPEDAIIITLINRLAPEKGLEFAIEGITLALSSLPAEVRSRIRVLLAGDGPLRSQVGANIRQHGVDTVCRLWGEAAPADVVMLLGISDIFLYSGTRGTNYSMAVLEAMAACCAVIASVSPQSNARLLDEGRGVPVEPGSSTAIGQALVRLCSDLGLCRQMGSMAREYVERYHSAQMLLRSLSRATHFAPALIGERDKVEVSSGWRASAM